MRLGYVLKNINHSRFNNYHDWEGMFDHLKRKRTFKETFFSVSMYILILNLDVTTFTVCNFEMTRKFQIQSNNYNYVHNWRCPQYGHIPHTRGTCVFILSNLPPTLWFVVMFVVKNKHQKHMFYNETGLCLSGHHSKFNCQQVWRGYVCTSREK
jgi:hypothetical protein